MLLSVSFAKSRDGSALRPVGAALYGDLAGLPPVRIHVGNDEILLDDSLRYGQRIESEGETVQVHSWEGMTHVLPSSIALLHGANEALDDIGDFLRRQFLDEPGTAR